MARQKKMPRLPNGYGSIRRLTGNRRNIYGVYPPQLEEDINGRRLPVKALCYVPTWTTAFAVLTAYHAGTYAPGMELEINYQPPTGAEIDAINGILADYSAIRRAARLGSAAAPTFAEIYKLFYEDKFNSAREYSNQYKQSIKSAFRNCAPLHDRPIAEITLDELQGIIDSCNLKHSSIELIKILYTGIYGYADARSLVPKNLAPYVKNPLVDDDEHGVPFSLPDIKALWDHADDPTVEMILIMCFSGYRISAYKKMVVDLDERSFLGGNKTAAGKNLKTPIHSAIFPIVCRRIQRDGCLLHGSTDAFRKHMYNALERIGLDKHTPHDCKHTFSFLLEKYAVRENDRKRLLGHKIGNVTNDVYGHRTLEDLRAEIEKIPHPAEM